MTAQASAVPPYWTRLGSFFLYPLAVEPLLACGAFALLSGLATLLFTPAKLIVELLVFVGTLRYGYKVLERTARGHLDDSQSFAEAPDSGKYRPYKQFVVIAVGLTICAYAAAIAGYHLAMLLFVFFALILPANVMVLAVTDDLGESMSPAHLWALMHGIGRPYLGLCACLLLLTSSSGGLLRLLTPLVPQAFIGIVAGFLGTWFIIVMFRLMGYALYQYHDVLGLAVDIDFERQTTASVRTDPAKQGALQTASLLKEGRYDEAITLARGELAGQPGDLPANLRLHRLLLAVPGQEKAMLAHATDWLPNLLRGGQARQAVDVIEAIWQQQADFLPALGASIRPLAEAFLEARRPQGAARLIKGFDRRFPGHADTASIYVLGARLLIEHHRDEAQARRVLDAVRQHYPETPAAAEAGRLGELLDRLAATSAASA